MEESFFINKIECWLKQILESGLEAAYCELSDHPDFPNISMDELNSVMKDQVLTLTGLDKSHLVLRVFEHEKAVNVEYSLPLNGSWSPLTAVFEFYQRDGEWHFSLTEIDVY